ncbi:[Pyruvate dehydrogenase [acetyl-transferring]]-phosphatase 1, mitochondrial [Pseudolycoriella hygida]|uniref:[Pyruvate dehydrogenase [acetyl-transferring]]-phosphatase 1, mitochondrial n=1 Tax=Pseudolycoriella hygida TaxID=35572 RepID=A0A9Q0MVJ4_9DIPT|nr:[Pyruvate dehydrogenase [acetyl-transferring]]-phosphatase 1, mitochondrial [Pseudolycoriella hygida]
MFSLSQVVERLSKIGEQIRFLTTSAIFYRTAVPKLSPRDVDHILRTYEHSQDFYEGSVKSYDSNQLPSNYPMEDSRSEASSLFTSGHLFGVFDGHAGPACAQVIAKRLMRYIGVSLVPPDLLKRQLEGGAESYSFLKCHNDKVDFVAEIQGIYEKSFSKYARHLCSHPTNSNIQELLENAFMRLDNDISNEALQSPSLRTMSVAMSGSVACVAHINGSNLHIASTGDCGAVLGSVTDTGQLMTTLLTNAHNSENVGECKRIVSEHPLSEKDTVIRGERLLGQLAPLRAFGDFRYKWPVDILQNFAVPQYGEHVIAQNYFTPPYLTAYPEVTHHILTPRDRFLIIASDGLWDVISPMQATQLVGEHMSGKAFLKPMELPKRDVTLGEVEEMLANRKLGQKNKPQDQNAATHLIRHALGGSDYGLEHSKIAHLLSLPQDVVRLFRDDITVTVVFFDHEYMAHST